MNQIIEGTTTPLDREAELQRRIERLEEMLANTERDLEQFLYAISHDLRGPLRSIMSSSMILIEDYAEVLGADGQSELQRQSRAAKRLNDIVEEILKVSRLGRQAMSSSNVDLSALSTDIARQVGADAEVEAGMSVRGDEKLLRTMLSALLDNSVKFAKRGEAARVKIGRENGAYYVKDQGIGFPAEKAEDIFKPFEKLHPDSEYPGWGMGLSTARLVAQRHGGKIWAEGQPEAGATFYFTLVPQE